MINVEKILNLPKLEKDDNFTFGCNMCGKCCRERDDILLTPLDLFKIAKYLNKSIKEIIQEYCECYEGTDSKIMIVRLKPREYRRTCPFAKGKCLIHPVKPAVCALYPLGRMTNFETKEFTYFLQSVHCGNKQHTQTVREWLQDLSILDEENFNILWHLKVMEVSEALRDMYGKYTINHAPINLALLLNLYVLYDLEKEFMPQFIANCNEVLVVIANSNSCFRHEIR